MSGNKIPNFWRYLVPMYKNKRDVQGCGNFRGIKLMSHIINMQEIVIQKRLREGKSISKNQLGFMPESSDYIYIPTV